MSDFCSLSVLISLLGYAPSFLGEFSHDTIVVAPSLSFLNVVKSYYLVLFSWRKLQKTKKNAALRRIFYLISPQGKHLRTYFNQIQEATVQGYKFCFWTFLVISHVTTVPVTYWMDPDRKNDPCLHFFIKLDEISFFR